MKKSRPKASEQKRKSRDTQGKQSGFRIFSILLYVLLYVFCVVAGVSGSLSQQYAYEVGSICEETITATKDVVDEYTTALLKEEAKQKVPPVYQMDNTVELQCESDIFSVFSSAEEVRQQARQIYLALPESSSYFQPSAIEWETILADSMGQLRALVPTYITDQNIYTIASMEKKDLAALGDALVEQVRLQFTEGITQDALSSVLETIRSNFVSNGSFSSEEAGLAHDIAGNTVVANMTYDLAATEAKKAAAAENVEDIVYQEGQNIVLKGEIISEAQYRLIKQLGLANTALTGTARWVFGALFLLLVFVVAGMYAFFTDKMLYEDRKTVLSVVCLTVLAVVLSLVCKRVDLRLCPVFVSVIIGAVVLQRRTALFYGCIASVIGAFVLSPNKAFFFDEQVLRSLLAQTLGSLVAIMLLRKRQSRGEYILAGVGAGFSAMLVYIGYGILNSFTWNQYLIVSLYALASGVTCGFLSVGILPVWESVFSLATPSRLLELTNPSQPLLRRLIIEAPGTYHHSMMVANLSEAAAEAVGANALLTRVAAYYHDVGKLSNPLMFKENQLNIENPHDQLTPLQSAEIIRRHIPDGIKLAEKNKLPREVVEVMSQHHGDGHVGYFYYMAKKAGELKDDADFRYQSKKPQTKEAGILMLADIVDAAIRANHAAAAPDLWEQIAKLVKTKYEEGQLDDCPLTMRDLVRIISAFAHVFEGASHQRIVYPEGAA